MKLKLAAGLIPISLFCAEATLAAPAIKGSITESRVSSSIATKATQTVGISAIRNPTGSPIRGCISLAGTNKPSGLYRIKIDDVEQVVYCENTIVHQGRRGGWTLVWSHLRNAKGNLTTDLTWDQAITLPARRKYVSGAEDTADLQLFAAYVGIRWWKKITGLDSIGSGEIMYQWAANYTASGAVDRRAICEFMLDENANWRLTVNSSGCFESNQNDLPGLFVYHSGKKFSSFDVDNDTYPENCAAHYSGNPWWYGDCWDGSVMGGGERQGAGYYNGAYWKGSDKQWGDRATGKGAGNGWIFVR